MKPVFILALLAALVLAACQPIQPSAPDAATVPPVAETAVDNTAFLGEWAGEIIVAGTHLNILVHLAEEGGVLSGTIDVPQQGATGIPLHDIVAEFPALAFQMLDGPGVASFDGAMTKDSTIAGSFTQGNATGEFTLARPAEVAEIEVPYVQEEVSFDSPGATLAGTLTLPEGDGPFPALVLVTGSGQQNRDEELPIVADYHPFRDIADHLTRAGFAVLRYDDRGAGASTGDFESATIDDFAADAQSAIDFLRTRPEIDPAQVGILGHSEGANVAAMIGANDPEVPWVISWAGTAVPGSDVIILQAALQAAAAGASEDEVATLHDQQAEVIGYSVAQDWEGMEASLRSILDGAYDQLTPEEQASVGEKQAAIDHQVEVQLEAAQSSWFQSFLAHNPADDWAKVTAPVLAFFGELDTQVDPSQNRPPMEAALAANPDVTVVEIPGANHLFQQAITGGAQEYSTLDPTLIPEFLNVLTTWLTKHATMVQ